MPSMARLLTDLRTWFVAALVLVIGAAPMSVSAQPADDGGGGGASAIAVPADATVESLFVDFLHYARLGRFKAADAFAQALLAHPDLDPVEVLGFANRHKDAVNTLTIIIQNSSISDNATKVLELIEQGEFEQRKNPERIIANIEQLGGNPQQEHFAHKHLADAGEYAIPSMVQTLLDPAKKDLWSRIVRALPKIGKSGVNPLVMALAVKNNSVRIDVIHALGEIGYPQAVPYLRKLMVDQSIPQEVMAASARAVERIEMLSGRPCRGTPDELFLGLSQNYYNEEEAVRADPRRDEANVWYWDEAAQALERIVVPQRIFGPVMAMRSSQESLRLQHDQSEAIALWLAANIRREARLGLSVESGDAEETATATDATRPGVFPRALYFTQAAGPYYAHSVLSRAVADNDSAVALGAIAALRITAGPVSLIGTENYKQPLVRALQFPDLVVRIRAALALGAALPKSEFAGSQQVVPVLALALAQTGRPQVIVVDSDESNLNRIADGLRAAGRDVIAETSFYRAMDRARVEFPALSGVLIATDLRDPALPAALQQLRSEFILAKMPVVVLQKPADSILAEELGLADRFTESVEAMADADAFTDALDRVLKRTGQTPMDTNLAASLALQAAETLRLIAVDGRTVYAFGAAEPALIGALAASDEQLQIMVSSVLALAYTPTAQRSIAHVALDNGNTDSLRFAAFRSLAESAKNNGNRLESDQVARLIAISGDEPNLAIRTAASEALGAINLANSRASEIIRGYYGG